MTKRTTTTSGQTGQSRRPSTFAVFRRRNFTLLWIAQFISTMGSGLTAIASSILVYRMTGSALSVGLMMLATALPGLFVGLIAGVFVDRFDRRRIMIAANLICAALVCRHPLRAAVRDRLALPRRRALQRGGTVLRAGAGQPAA